MTREPDDLEESAETPDELPAHVEAELSALLRGLREDEVALPADVAARVQTALADAAPPAATASDLGEPLAVVRDLGEARETRAKPWRRRAAGLLVAAAAVVALGVGVPPLLDGARTGETQTTAGDAREAPTPSSADLADDEARSYGGPSQDGVLGGGGGAPPAPESQLKSAAPALPTIDPGREGAGLRRLARTWAAQPTASGYSGSLCDTSLWPRGQWREVQYGDEIVYALRTRRGAGRVQVSLRRCGEAEAITSVVVPR